MPSRKPAMNGSGSASVEIHWMTCVREGCCATTATGHANTPGMARRISHRLIRSPRRLARGALAGPQCRMLAKPCAECVDAGAERCQVRETQEPDATDLQLRLAQGRRSGPEHCTEEDQDLPTPHLTTSLCARVQLDHKGDAIRRANQHYRPLPFME